MAISPKDDIQNTLPATAAYPEGRAKNSSGPLTFDGTPYNETVLNDIWGFLQTILVAGGISPNNSPDSINNQQYLNALKAAFVTQTDASTVNLTNGTPLVLQATNAKVLFAGTSVADALARIGSNDGDGDLGFRYGHRIIGGVATHIGDNAAVEMAFIGEGTDGSIRFRISDQGLDGDPVVWLRTFRLDNGALRTIGTSMVVDGNCSVQNGSFIGPAAVLSGTTYALLCSATASQILMDGADDATALRRITWNDGGGNWNFRSGNRYDAGDKHVGANGATLLNFQSDGINGAMVAKVANVGADGAIVNWLQTLILNAAGLQLNGIPIDGRFVSNGNGFYQTSPGGVIRQWGKATRGAAQQNQTFPIPFTNLSSVVVQVSPNQQAFGKKEVAAMLNGVTTTGFTYQVRDVDGNNATFENSQINWTATGI